MQLIAALMLFIVPLGGGFGEAAGAATVNNDGTISVQLQVEVDADMVVAHVIDPGGEQETLSLVRRSDGSFGGTAITERSNRIVVFEAFVGDESVLSQPVTFLELGVGPSFLGIDEGPDLLAEPPAPADGVVLGLDRSDSIWVAVALAAVSLALIAWWAAGPRSMITEPPIPDDPPDDEPHLVP